MKHRLLPLAALVFFVGGLSAADPVRILRIGDSITWQQSGDGTLPDRLDAAGIHYVMVGTQNWFDDGGYVPGNLAREEDQYSEGYPAMTVEWFTDPDFSWAAWQARPTTIERGFGNTPIIHALSQNSPDIILLMIGTNNTVRDKNGERGESSSGEVDVAFLSQKYEDLLSMIDFFAPEAHVFVAEMIDVIDTGEGNGANRSARTLHFNEHVVRPVVQARIDAGLPFTLLNFFDLLDVPGDFMDSVHPNDAGIQKMSHAWADAILAHLGPSDPDPDPDPGPDPDPDPDPVPEPYWVDTGDFLGWLAVVQFPWVYSLTLNNWIYMTSEEADLTSSGWIYIPRKQ
ncbi:MAG: hypothetical protein JJT96_20515 [Opitutales bacterium]|nr:hypothetical protein [Opitutales bacterium]